MTVFVAVQCGIDKEECEDTVLVGDRLICNGNMDLFMPLSGAVCIADGVGGNAGGHFASTFVTERIKSIFEPLVDEKKVRQLLDDINISLIEESEAHGFPTAATTLTGIVFTDNNEYLVHVGNTRAYVLQGKYLKQLTSDHTVFNRLLKMGLIDDAAQSKKNQITNCFGGGKTALLESMYTSKMQDYGTLLLTSDGVHDYIEIGELEHLLTADILNIQTCNNIIQAAYDAGSRDDISVVLIQK